jgi:hypothetical protein
VAPAELKSIFDAREVASREGLYPFLSKFVHATNACHFTVPGRDFGSGTCLTPGTCQAVRARRGRPLGLANAPSSLARS